MFDNSFFEKWLDERSETIITKLGTKEALTSEEMIILVLKAQTNHFHHLDQDLRKDMKTLILQIDKRFEQVDKRFERIYSFMKWQTGIGFALLSGLYLKLFLG